MAKVKYIPLSFVRKITRTVQEYMMNNASPKNHEHFEISRGLANAEQIIKEIDDYLRRIGL